MKINKFIAAVMALTIVGGSVPFISDIAPDTVITASAADYKEVTEGDFTFKVYSDHAELTKYTSTSVKDVTIPETAGGQPVTFIGEAFYGNKYATAVVIPDSVKEIGNYAFSGCSNLTEVTIGNGVEKIGNNAFAGCGNMVDLTFGNSVASIGNSAVSNCSSLTEITLPQSVTVLDSSAFSGCSSLVSFEMSDGIKILNNNTFSGCKSLRNVKLSKNLVTLSSEAFYNCSSLKSIDIPDGVTEIGTYAFFNCSNLGKAVIGKGVTSIGANAFAGCSKLTDLTIGENVMSIDYSAFSNCSSLTELNIPDKVEVIGNSAFSGCSALTTVSMGDSVTTLNNNVFSGCKALTKVTLSKKLKTISNEAFYNCSKLESITIPDTVSVIGLYVFFGTALKSLDLPKSVKTIDGHTLDWCQDLTELKVYNPNLVFKSDLGMDKTVTIFGYADSTAQEYAEEHGNPFVAFTEEPTTTTAATTTKATSTTTTSTTTTTAKTTPSTPVTTTSKDTLYGDVNCDGVVDIEDATLLKSYLADAKIKISPQGLINADVYHPGLGLDEVDTEFIMKSINGEAAIPVMPKTSAPAQPTATFGDINGDDVIDGRDASMLLTYYAKTSTGYKGTLEQFVKGDEEEPATTAAPKTTVTTATTTAKTSVTTAVKTTILTFQVTGAGNPVLTTAVKVDDLNNVDDSWQQAALDEWLKNRQ